MGSKYHHSWSRKAGGLGKEDSEGNGPEAKMSHHDLCKHVRTQRKKIDEMTRKVDTLTQQLHTEVENNHQLTLVTSKRLNELEEATGMIQRLTLRIKELESIPKAFKVIRS